MMRSQLFLDIVYKHRDKSLETIIFTLRRHFDLTVAVFQINNNYNLPVLLKIKWIQKVERSYQTAFPNTTKQLKEFISIMNSVEKNSQSRSYLIVGRKSHFIKYR